MAAVVPELLVGLVLGRDMPQKDHFGLKRPSAVLTLPGPVLVVDGPDMSLHTGLPKKDDVTKLQIFCLNCLTCCRGMSCHIPATCSGAGYQPGPRGP